MASIIARSWSWHQIGAEEEPIDELFSVWVCIIFLVIVRGLPAIILFLE